MSRLGVRRIERAESLGKRLLRARLEVSVRQDDKVTQAKLGQRVAERLGRSQVITGATVSRWESDESAPDLPTLEAIAAVCEVDPGWLAFGDKSRAPKPWEPVTGLRAVKHEGDILAAQLSMDRQALIERAAAFDREWRGKLMSELQSIVGVDSKEARRRADEIIRELRSPSRLERVHQDLFGDENEHERRLEYDDDYRRRWYGEDEEKAEDNEENDVSMDKDMPEK